MGWQEGQGAKKMCVLAAFDSTQPEACAAEPGWNYFGARTDTRGIQDVGLR